jgi:hypothetical protein
MKFNYFIFLFSFLIFISCSSDDDSGNNSNDLRAENLKSLGASAEELLSNNTYKSLTVEFAFNEGLRPRQETLDAFKIFLEERLHKPDGITFVETEISTPLVDTHSINDIRAIEAAQRSFYTVGDDIAVFIYFTHAKSEGDTETTKTLGTAYYNTSLVVFEQTLRNLNISQGFDLFILEETTLQHEFGHLLGLVNLINDDIHGNHEDTAHANHCIVEDCLMYYASNKSSSFRNRSSVPLLDVLCIEDLQAKGGK